MKKNSFIINKYTLSLFILLVYLATDIVLHKGMSRVIMPKSFTEKRSPQNFTICNQPLTVTGKKWVKAVNTTIQMEQFPADAGGFEMDVYFDTSKKCLLVYHDSSAYSQLNIADILNVYKARKLSSSIWFDFKNLSAANEKQSLIYIASLRQQFSLNNKLIVESSAPQYLQSFCDSGFYTSYYVPFFNPYLLTEKETIQIIDKISNNLSKYPTAALSGYYFQYPFLKRYFPNYPVLTWANESNLSLVGYIFNRMLLTDERVKIVLYW
jgi:hypothetical protein